MPARSKEPSDEIDLTWTSRRQECSAKECNADHDRFQVFGSSLSRTKARNKTAAVTQILGHILGLELDCRPEECEHEDHDDIKYIVGVCHRLKGFIHDSDKAKHGKCVFKPAGDNTREDH